MAPRDGRTEDVAGRDAATLRDVARVARVHTSTVSRALNGTAGSRINVDTVVRIREIAEGLGYSPNSMARGLRTRRSHLVGVIVTDLINPVIAPLVRGIEERLENDGYTVLLGNTDYSRERERRQIAAMRAKQVDGLISATAPVRRSEFGQTLDIGLPVVLVSRTVDDDTVPSAVPDDGLCAELAVGHLTELGHVRLAHVAGPPRTTTGLKRRLGFEDAMARRGLPVDPALVAVARRYALDEGRQLCEQLLDGKADFTAIVAANDLLALGCLDALAAAGLRCPEDVSVVGCNDMPLVDRVRPALTTVRIPHLDLGEAAADLLLERLTKPTAPARQVVIAPKLVVRESTAPPRRGRTEPREVGTWH